MNKIDLNNYGKYRMGLTFKEIKEYLKNRAKKTQLGNLYNRFCRIAGVNTVVIEDGEFLLYRHDVQRFADELFLGKETYWD